MLAVLRGRLLSRIDTSNANITGHEDFHEERINSLFGFGLKLRTENKSR